MSFKANGKGYPLIEWYQLNSVISDPHRGLPGCTHSLHCPYFGCAALISPVWWQIFGNCQGEILLRDCVPNRAKFHHHPQVQSHGVFVWEETFLCLAVLDPRTQGVPRTFVAIKDPPWSLAPKQLSHSREGQRHVCGVRNSGCKFYQEREKLRKI